MIDNIISRAKTQFPLEIDGIHGLGHWARVRRNGLYLAEHTDADKTVVECFAYLHDCCRQDDGIDKHHGKRAADHLYSIRDNALHELTAKQFLQLYDACEEHSNGHTSGYDMTILTCWDADRLDLCRLGITPLPSKLCTEYAKQEETIEWASNLKKVKY